MIRLLWLAFGHISRRKAVSITAFTLSGLMAAAVITITGDAATDANALLQTLRDPEARSVVLRSSNPTNPVSRGTAQMLASLPGVEIAIALATAESVTAPGLHDPSASIGLVHVETLAGSIPVRVLEGRAPLSHEVIVSWRAASALRMSQPLATGVLTNSGVLPVVGLFTVDDRGPVSDLLSYAAIGVGGELSEGFSTVAILVREPADVRTVVDAANLLIADRQDVSIDYEPRAAAIEETIGEAGRRNTASLALSLVIVGALIQIASALLNSVLQRRENARRRALGFTRGEIVALGMIEAGLLSAIGASVGSALATARLVRDHAVIQPGQLVATVGFLTILAILAAVPGGANAAMQDPARILRVP